MAFEVIVMPSAVADLEEHADYIARDSIDQARKWLIEAWEKILSLREMPKRFAVIDESQEVGQELRSVLHYSHRIVYLVNDTDRTVVVLRVWHGARLPLGTDDIE